MLTLKLFQESIDQEKISGYAFDLGVYREIFHKIMLGCVIQNIGPAVKFIDDKTRLPVNFKIGAGYRLPFCPLLIVADLDKPVDNSFEVSFGAEYMVRNRVDLRLLE